jgi:hypothetical protein
LKEYLWVNLTYDPINPQVFLQQEAEIMGWVNCITYVLDCNEAARIEAVAAANNNNGQS